MKIIDLNLTPAEAFASQEIRRPEDMERIREKSLRLAGASYFFVDCWNLQAHLALMQFDEGGHSCRSTQISVVEMDGLGISAEMLPRAVDLAGGAINMSGHYPISDEIRERLASRG